jgi:hypothetical protein
MFYFSNILTTKNRSENYLRFFMQTIASLISNKHTEKQTGI